MHTVTLSPFVSVTPLAMHISNLRKFLPCCLALTIASLLTACAGLPAHSLSAADRANVRTVTLNPVIGLPKELSFQSRRESLMMGGFGLIGALLSIDGAKESARDVVSTMNRNNISIRTIATTEFKRALVAIPYFTVTDDKAIADAELTLVVNYVGLSQTHGLSALLYPIMSISATMRRKDGAVIWQKSDHISPLNSENKDGYEFADYLAQPALLRSGFSATAAVLSRDLVAELKPPK